MALRITSTSASAACLLLTACDGGKLAATGTGDVSNPPALRIAAGAEADSPCGDGSRTEAGTGVVKRMPYLQRVTSTSAAVLFTTTADGAIVDCGLADGLPVESMPAERDPGAPSGEQWVVELDDLEPDTSYCYSVRGMTEAAELRTAPLPGQGAPVRFVAFGDSGNGSLNQRIVRDQMETVAFDLIVHTGDVAYSSGTLPQLEQYFFDVYEEMIGRVPVYPAVGNHDYLTADAAPYFEVFSLPDNGGPAAPERWYSFDWGDVHFVALDTQRISERQAAWLEEDLRSTDLPWIVTYLHAPPYSSGDHGSNLAARELFTPLFEAYGVQLVLAGHEHDYERTKPINGITYVVTGGGGRGSRSVGTSSFTAFAEEVLHFVYVEIERDTLLLHAIDGVGREFDSTRIDL